MPEALRVFNAYGEFGFRLRPEVVDVNRLFIDDRPTANRAADKRLFKTEPRLNRPIVGYESEYISLDESNHRIVGTAYTRSILGDDVQHRLNVRRQSGDKTQNLACRRLLLCSLGALSLRGFKLFGETLYFFFELAQFGSARTLFFL